MIGMLTGTIAQTTHNPIIVNVHGVGYAVFIPARTVTQLHLNGTSTFFIHTHVSDDALDLYGFLSQDELDLFKLLLTVSGIGPRTATSIMDRSASAIQTAIMTSDVDFFTTIPRLGRKNAQKIIIELKSKLGSTKELDLSDDSEGETKQLLDALLSMGFARNEIIGAIKKLDKTDVTLEQKVRHALKNLGKSV